MNYFSRFFLLCTIVCAPTVFHAQYSTLPVMLHDGLDDGDNEPVRGGAGRDVDHYEAPVAAAYPSHERFARAAGHLILAPLPDPKTLPALEIFKKAIMVCFDRLPRANPRKKAVLPKSVKPDPSAVIEVDQSYLLPVGARTILYQASLLTITFLDIIPAELIKGLEGSEKKDDASIDERTDVCVGTIRTGNRLTQANIFNFDSISSSAARVFYLRNAPLFTEPLNLKDVAALRTMHVAAGHSDEAVRALGVFLLGKRKASLDYDKQMELARSGIHAQLTNPHFNNLKATWNQLLINFEDINAQTKSDTTFQLLQSFYSLNMYFAQKYFDFLARSNLPALLTSEAILAHKKEAEEWIAQLIAEYEGIEPYLKIFYEALYAASNERVRLVKATLPGALSGCLVMIDLASGVRTSVDKLPNNPRIPPLEHHCEALRKSLEKLETTLALMKDVGERLKSYTDMFAQQLRESAARGSDSAAGASTSSDSAEIKSLIAGLEGPSAAAKPKKPQQVLTHKQFAHEVSYLPECVPLADEEPKSPPAAAATGAGAGSSFESAPLAAATTAAVHDTEGFEFVGKRCKLSRLPHDPKDFIINEANPDYVEIFQRSTKLRARIYKLSSAVEMASFERFKGYHNLHRVKQWFVDPYAALVDQEYFLDIEGKSQLNPKKFIEFEDRDRMAHYIPFIHRLIQAIDYYVLTSGTARPHPDRKPGHHNVLVALELRFEGELPVHAPADYDRGLPALGKLTYDFYQDASGWQCDHRCFDYLTAEEFKGEFSHKVYARTEHAALA